MECSEKQDELQVEWNFLKVGAEWGDGDELSDIEGEGADGDGGDVLGESGVDVGSSFLHHSSVPVTPVSAVVAQHAAIPCQQQGELLLYGLILPLCVRSNNINSYRRHYQSRPYVIPIT